MSKTPEQLVGEVDQNIKAMNATNAELQKELKALVENSGKETSAAVEKVNGLAGKLEGFASNLLALEQKMAENVKEGLTPVETLGQMVIKSDAYKQFASGNARSMRIQANTITGQEGSPPANSRTIVESQRIPGIIPGAFRLLRVRDVIPTGVTSSNLIEFTRELLFTNNAAETAEGAQKPESVLTFELASAPVVTIATFLKASKQVLEDAPQLQSYIDTRLRYAVDYRLDTELLNGDGTGQNLGGVLKSGNHTVFTPVTGDNALDSINRAIYLVIAADYAPTAIIMNPADWGAIERLKVGGSSDQRYVVGDPTAILGPQLWGLPVVVSNAVPAGKFIVGSMPIAYQYFSRQETVVEAFEQDGDNVQKNLITVRAENRGALAVYRPASVRAGNLTL